MFFHALFPVPGGFLTVLARTVRLEGLLGRFPERWCPGLAFLGERVAPGPRQFSVEVGFVPRNG